MKEELNTQPPPPPDLGPSPPAAETCEKLRILLIDDSEIALAVHQEALTEAGFDVRSVQTLGEFDVLLTTWTPHFILSDVQMPGMNGDELCRTMKTRCGTHVPFVLLSDLPIAKLREIATNAGADGFLSKSEERETLVHQVKVYCSMAYSPDRVRWD